MNDEFLHALRRDPPPAFARELKQRLERQSGQRRTRSTIMRAVLGLFLVGGVAMAAALLLRDRHEQPIQREAVTEPAAPNAGPPAAQAERISLPGPQVSSDGSAQSQPQASPSAQSDYPVAFVTTALTRPLAQVLAESVRMYGAFAQARVMEMDDDEAFRALCSNADFVMVSRRISENEFAQCRKWGSDLSEWLLGYQAVVLTAGPAAVPAALTPREVFLALARRIPDPAEPSRLIDNPNATWHDIDARLDYRNIDVLIPSDATTRAAFQYLILEPGCDTYPWIRKLRQADRPLYYDICHQLRGDGHYREVDLTSTFITQRLWAEPDWLVVFRYSYYAEHRAELLDTMLEGPPAALATLVDGTYPAARPVYVYARRSQLNQNPGARILAYQLTSPSAVGPQGFLLRQGLVPRDGIVRPMQQGHPLTAPLPPALEALQPAKEHVR